MRRKKVIIGIIILCISLCIGFLIWNKRNSGSSIEEVKMENEEKNEEEAEENEISLEQKGTIETYNLDEEQNPYNSHHHLDVATYLNKINDMYFIVDCYHDQIIFHDNLEDDLSYWHVLTDKVHYAHTIASDGTVYLVDDTENNRVLVFQKIDNQFVQTQTFDSIGQWPHYVQYIPQLDAFYAWSSVTGEMYIFKRDHNDNNVYLADKKQITELYGVYIRSFSVIDNELFFVSGHGNKKIVVANLETLEVKKEYNVANEISGMAQITKIQDWYYITVSTDNQENQEYANFIRTKDLNSLENGEYEEIYDLFTQKKGTPYYISQIGETYYLTNHRTDENIYSFEVIDNEIKNVKVLY